MFLDSTIQYIPNISTVFVAFQDFILYIVRRTCSSVIASKPHLFGYTGWSGNDEATGFLGKNAYRKTSDLSQTSPVIRPYVGYGSCLEIKVA